MLSDNQKRFACRLAFLMLCVLPTAATVYHILHPQTAADWQQQIQSQLGVHTRIDSVETPGPHQVILRGVEFFDADLNPILTATEAKILFGDVNQIVLNHPVRLTSDGLRHLTDQLNQQLIRSHSVAKPWHVVVRLAVVESNLVSDDQFGTSVPRELRIEDALVTVESRADDTLAQVEFSLIDVNSPTPAGQPNRIHCALGRQRTDSLEPAGQVVKLNTGDDALPCWLAHAWLPKLNETMGTEVAFSGQVQLDVTSPALAGNAVGEFFEVDLQMVTRPGVMLANRWGNIEVEQCEFRGNDVQHLAFLSMPGTGLPRMKMEMPLEAYQQVNVAQAIHDATLQSVRRLNDRTFRR